MTYKNCGCRDDNHDACPQCEGWSQAELDRSAAKSLVEEHGLGDTFKFYVGAEKMVDKVMKVEDDIRQIDIEIEACESAISHAFAIVDVEELAKRVAELIQRRHLLQQTLG